jgi:hypothetical protein
MRGTVYKRSLTLLAVLALAVLAAAGLFLLGGKQAAVQAAPAQSPVLEPVVPQQPDNSMCLACHSRPDEVHQFPNGDTVSITVDEQAYGQGVHAALACQTCHTNITEYPHPENTAQSAKEYTLQYKGTCNQCHPGQAEDIKGSAHAKLAEMGNENTPLCADCHTPHATAPIKKDANGDPAPEERANIATICSQCHSAIVEQYKQSVHGEGVFGEHNPDVPACNDCHGIHKITQARTVEFRLDSPNLCSNCHTRPEIMDKYGISTDVMDTYVSDFHGTTVMLFEPAAPGQDTNKPVCYDCHGVHNIAAVDDPERGLEVKKNMLTSCQKCHPDATENFPTSWMSHYIATPTRFPLVYYVQLFYKFFVPGVLGVMLVFVVSDILYKAGITGRKPKSGQANKE